MAENAAERASEFSSTTIDLVTKEKLKQASGEFCLESIFILDFSGRGICLLGSIPRCVNLCILNLSSNNLSAVGELGVLSSLEHLDLSNNNISELDGLSRLEKLTRLELAGNEIHNIDSILPLSSLYGLKHLTLQLSLPSHSSAQATYLTNPVCQDPTYGTAVTEMFPGLVWLDREVIKEGAAGNEFFSECKAIQNRSEYTWGCDEKENMQHNQGDPHMESPMGKLDPLEAIFNEDDQRIEDLLDECKKTSNQIQQHIKEIKTELETDSIKWTGTA